MVLFLKRSQLLYSYLDKFIPISSIFFMIFSTLPSEYIFKFKGSAFALKTCLACCSSGASSKKFQHSGGLSAQKSLLFLISLVLPSLNSVLLSSSRSFCWFQILSDSSKSILPSIVLIYLISLKPSSRIESSMSCRMCTLMCFSISAVSSHCALFFSLKQPSQTQNLPQSSLSCFSRASYYYCSVKNPASSASFSSSCSL